MPELKPDPNANSSDSNDFISSRTLATLADW